MSRLVNKVVKSALTKLVPAGFRPALKLAYGRIRYFGFTYECPFCKSSFRELLPFGFAFPVLTEKRVVPGGRRRNCICPACGSLDRERLLYLYLLYRTYIFSRPCKLLHMAPEEQLRKTLRRSANIRYVTADLLAPNVMARMDITRLALPDGFFDVILCCHVLEHIPDDRQALRELYRVLKPGGWAILQVPVSQELEETFEDFSITTPHGREEAFGQADHVRLYARDYEARLAGAGFQVEIFRWWDEPGKFGGLENRFSLISQEPVYIAIKT